MPISQINTNSIANGAVVAADLAAGAALSNLGTSQLARANMASGSVLQVVTTTKTDTASFTSGSFTNLTGLSVAITPSSTTSRIFVFVSVGLVGVAANQALTVAFRIMRDNTAISVGNAAGSRPQASFRIFTQADSNHGRSASFSCVDSPSSISSITYALQAATQDGQVAYINRTANDSDGTNAYQARCASTITVVEIAA
jgi:hypothetical protein